MALDYNTLEAIVAEKYLPNLYDNIFLKHSPLLAWLSKNSIEFEGREIVVPIEYNDISNAQMVNEYDSISVTPGEVATAAKYDPKMAVASLVIDKQEEIKTRTPLAIKSMVDTKMSNVEKGFAASFTRAMYKLPESDGTKADSSYFNSIPYLVNNHATASIGNISPSDMANWKSHIFQATDFTDSFSRADMINSAKDTYIKTLFQVLLAAMKFRTASSDVLFLVPQYFWDTYEYVLDLQKQGSPLGEKKGVAGFDTLFFRNAKIVVDDAMVNEQSSATAAEVMCLNADFLKFAFSPGAKMASEPFVLAQNAMTRVKKFYTMGNLITTARNSMARLHNIEVTASYVTPGSANAIASAS